MEVTNVVYISANELNNQDNVGASFEEVQRRVLYTLSRPQKLPARILHHVQDECC